MALLERCHASLLRSAALNHSIIQTALVLSHDNDFYEPPFWFWTVEIGDEVLGAAIYAAPDGLVLSEMPTKALPALCEALIEQIPVPMRVIGGSSVVESFVANLAKRSGLTPMLSNSWHVGRLNSVVKPNPLAPGRLRLADSSYAELVRTWGTEYGKEKPSFLDVAEFMAKKLKGGDLYLWEDGEPITMMTVSGRSDNGVRISSVFTPPRHRGFGYASSAIATMSGSLLECGHDFVILTWRIGDPAGRIYQRLGFRPIGIQKSFVCR